MQLITDTSFGAAGLMGRVDVTPRRADWTLVEWPHFITSVPPTDLRMAFPSVVHPGRPNGRRALSAPAEPRPPNIGTGFHRGSHWTRELATPLTPRVGPPRSRTSDALEADHEDDEQADNDVKQRADEVHNEMREYWNQRYEGEYDPKLMIDRQTRPPALHEEPACGAC